MVEKRITKSKEGEVHFGVNSVEGFDLVAPTGHDSGEPDFDLDGVLNNLGSMRLWRCTVCNDLHVGAGFPEECPTCHTKNVYVEVDEKGFRAVFGLGK